MALLNINPMLLMAKPTVAELTFLLLMLAISVAGKVMPQMAKGTGQAVRIFSDANHKK